MLESDIFFWTRHDEYGALSNFTRAPIEVDGKLWPTSEHYYQGMKSDRLDEQEMIRLLGTPKEAKFAGYHVSLRSNWELLKERYMLTALRAKFTQHEHLKQALLSTGYARLHENSPWDKYWGYVDGKGKDRLGQLLMQVREELRSEKVSEPPSS